MTRAYSNGLHERVVDAVICGDICSAAADRFVVSKSSVTNWMPLSRGTGSVAPGKMGGHRTFVLAPHQESIQQHLQQTSHPTRQAIKSKAVRGAIKATGAGQ